MVDTRNKSVRIDEKLNRALKALAGFYDARSDEILEKALTLLWEKTFPGIAMPTDEPAPKRKK